MTPQQIARLALEWYRANKANPIETARRACWQYCYTPEQTQEAIEQLRAIWPSYYPALEN